MERLMFDTGMQEFEMPGGILRFNPKDPNLYQRFMEAGSKVLEREEKLVAEGAALEKSDQGITSEAILALLAKADQDVKNILNDVFGGSNDFDKLLQGVNVMAVGNNGERVITNLLNALQPVMAEGAQVCADSLAESALREAQNARIQRANAAKPADK